MKTPKMSPLEAFMAGITRTGRGRHLPRVSLNSDGRPHPQLNAASVLTLVIGFVSFALGMLLRYDSGGIGVAIAAAATGLVSLIGGLITQMMSATREQRILTVIGIIAGFVGLALGLAHGGLAG